MRVDVGVFVCAHGNCFLLLFISNARQQAMAAAAHTCSSACQCANQTSNAHTHTHTHTHTHIQTHTNTVPTSPCLVRVSSTLKNPVFVPSALKKSVLMISLSLSLSLSVGASLCFHLLSFSLFTAHPLLVFTEKLIISISPPLLFLCLSHPAFIY